jgi:hypothetical protein
MGSKECRGSRLYVVKDKIRVNTLWFFHCSRLKRVFSLAGLRRKERILKTTTTMRLLLTYGVEYLLGLLEQEAPF